MPKIHGLVYVLVGLFVSVLSWRLNYQKLIFFFYAGLIFVFVGIIKIIFNFIKKKNGVKSVQHVVGSQHHTRMQHQQRFNYCSKCRNVVRVNDLFCGKCGNRF